MQGSWYWREQKQKIGIIALKVLIFNVYSINWVNGLDTATGKAAKINIRKQKRLEWNGISFGLLPAAREHMWMGII